MLKKLLEKRNDLHAEMQKLLSTAKTEERAFSDDEEKRFNELETEIKKLDATIKAEERAEALKIEEAEKEEEKREETEATPEERAFENYIRGTVENREDVNFTVGSNGAVIPTSIANKIIEKVVEICPIYQMCDRYNVAGPLQIPYYDETTNKITMAYATEFSELSSTAGAFGSITLNDYLAGVLTKVSRTLINKAFFNLTDYVVNKVAEAISAFIEKELIKGTSGKIDGLAGGVTLTVTTASATAVTADELMDVQDKVVDAHQAKAIWIMNRTTRNAIRKLKDNDGQYLLNRDMTAKWGYTLLGKDVYTTDTMDEIGSEKTVIYYGDMTGLACKVSEEVSIEVLREKYATQHAIGVVGWVALDAKVEDTQKIAKLVCKKATA